MLAANPAFTTRVCLDGYELKPIAADCGDSPWRYRVVPASNSYKQRPAGHFRTLYQRFSDIDFSPKAYLEFASEYGAFENPMMVGSLRQTQAALAASRKQGEARLEMLDRRPPLPDKAPREIRRHERQQLPSASPQKDLVPAAFYSSLADWVELHRAVRLVLGQAIDDAPRERPEGELRGRDKAFPGLYDDPTLHLQGVVVSSGMQPAIEYDPKTGLSDLVVNTGCLQAFIALQVFEQLKLRGTSGASEIRYCPQCQQPFAVGGKAGRRRSASFCSIACGGKHRYQLKIKK